MGVSQCPTLQNIRHFARTTHIRRRRTASLLLLSSRDFPHTHTVLLLISLASPPPSLILSLLPLHPSSRRLHQTSPSLAISSKLRLAVSGSVGVFDVRSRARTSAAYRPRTVHVSAIVCAPLLPRTSPDRPPVRPLHTTIFALPWPPPTSSFHRHLHIRHTNFY
jgi:hypothetical protein